MQSSYQATELIRLKVRHHNDSRCLHQLVPRSGSDSSPRRAALCSTRIRFCNSKVVSHELPRHACSIKPIQKRVVTFVHRHSAVPIQHAAQTVAGDKSSPLNPLIPFRLHADNNSILNHHQHLFACNSQAAKLSASVTSLKL